MLIKFIPLLFLMSLIVTSCAYDPAMGELRIENRTDSLIYVTYACQDEIPEIPQIGPVDSTLGFNASHNIKNSDARIASKSYGFILGFGTPEQKWLPCKDGEKLNLFFLSDYTLRHYNCSAIRKNSMYNKTISFNQKQLDSMNWIVTFK